MIGDKFKKNFSAIDDFRIDLQHQHELASLTDANKLPLSLKEHRQILEGLKGTLRFEHFLKFHKVAFFRKFSIESL